MQKRSHRLLASTLLKGANGFPARRYELAFLFGSFQPDCNPLTYLKGSLREQRLRGHNFRNSEWYINDRIRRLQRRVRWSIWQYYTLGKLTHYLADAYTYPHNDNYPSSLMDHRRYENALREYLAAYLNSYGPYPMENRPREELVDVLRRLHSQYMEASADMCRDARFILEATWLLMDGCLPQTVSGCGLCVSGSGIL